MRCDRHVHSWYSGRTDVPVLEHLGRECYSDPLEVCEQATRRGMDLVTLTDHDSIDGGPGLAHRARRADSVAGRGGGGVSVFSLVALSDDRVWSRMLGWRPPRWVRLWMLWASRLGDGWVWGAMALVLALCGEQGQRVLAGSAVAASLANVVLFTAKKRFRRSRPCDRLPSGDPHVRPLAWFPSDRFSFPSGHALNAFAIGSVVSLGYPSLAVPLLALASSVAASRVVLGLHWLSDVVAGALAGALIGAATGLLLLG